VPKILIADYVHSGYAPTWPTPFKTISSIEGPGRIYNIAQTNPAQGAEVVLTVPTNARWRFLGGEITLTASSAAGTRQPGFAIDDGTVANYLWRSLMDITGVGANGVSRFGIVLQGATTSFQTTLASNAGGTYFYLPPVILPAGYRLRTATNSLGTGDQYSALNFLVEEWIEN